MMSEVALSQINAAVDYLQPEAEEYVGMIKDEPIPLTKDNYGKVMAFLSGLGEAGWIFLIAMVRAGYPADTAEQLARIMGYPSRTAEFWEEN